MTTSTSRISTRLFSRCTLALTTALALTACPGGDDTSSGADASTSTTGDADTSTTGDTTPPTTEAATEPTTGATTEPATDTTATTTTGDTATTDPVDPCDSCDPNAACMGDTCMCEAGWEGDGTSCTDIDECAGDNDCAIDASCNNTPGDYECECKAGYKGNGKECNDIDECTQDLDNCSDNGICTNQDGAFKCTCKEGFTGNGITCNGDAKFGDPCTKGEDCASGLCLTDGDGQCTITCTQDVANDCGAQGVFGLCIPVGMDTFVCAGDLNFGTDKGDDDVLGDGDKSAGVFQSKTDSDVFLIKLDVAGDYQIAATPDPDDDIQVEFYNGDATELGVSNMGGAGVIEGGVITVQPGAPFFVVVRNIGNSNGNYSIEVTKV